MAKTANGLVEWSKEQLGKPYWYGTFHMKCTDSLYEQKKKQYPSHYTSDRTSRYKADIAAGKICMDCVGMIKGYIWESGGNIKYDAKTDVSADGMYNASKEKGSIGSIPDIPGILVWCKGHIGVYIGSGEVIEARGFAYGVVKTKVKDRTWTNWCKCPYITYNEAPVSTPTPVQTPSPAGFVVKRLLKKNLIMMRGDDVRWLQERLSASGHNPKGIDGIFGNNTKIAVQSYQKAKGLSVDGIAGKNTITSLGGVWQG